MKEVLKIFSRNLRKKQTDAERKMWSYLRNRQISGYKFRRQHRIHPFIVDFCCVEMKLIIELDGSQHLSNKLSDENRTRLLEKKGFRVLRFWDNHVFNQGEAILEVIHSVLVNPHPALSLRKGEGEENC